MTHATLFVTYGDRHTVHSGVVVVVECAAGGDKTFPTYGMADAWLGDEHEPGCPAEHKIVRVQEGQRTVLRELPGVAQ